MGAEDTEVIPATVDQFQIPEDFSREIFALLNPGHQEKWLQAENDTSGERLLYYLQALEEELIIQESALSLNRSLLSISQNNPVKQERYNNNIQTALNNLQTRVPVFEKFGALAHQAIVGTKLVPVPILTQWDKFIDKLLRIKLLLAQSQPSSDVTKPA